MTQKQYTYEMVEELYQTFNPNAVDGSGARIIVAEDNPPMRKLVAQALQRKGFEVFEAPDGLEALKIIRAQAPDLAILDIQMPKVTGLSILEAMRRDERFRNTPVIMATARKNKKDVVLAQKLQASAYILKPFKMEDVLAKVAELLEQARTAQASEDAAAAEADDARDEDGLDGDAPPAADSDDTPPAPTS